MKYFTPEQFVRLQDHSGKKRFQSALNRWEGAAEAYRRHLNEIRPRLPAGLRKLLQSTSLHDAQIVDMWHRKSRFTITLLPEADPSRLIILAYSLVESPRIDREALPEAARTTQIAWLYDELNIKTSSNGLSPMTFFHNILLSNGWEMHLHFRRVAVTRPDTLVPATRDAGPGTASVSRSA